MTFAMSTEGDSVKSALSEANDKDATDNHTDSSQDSMDAKVVQSEKPTENNIGAEKDVEKPGKEDSTEGESDQESAASEKKEEEDAKKNEENPEVNDKKPENDTDAVNKEDKELKSEEDEEEGEEEEEEDKEEKVTKKEEKDSKEKKDIKEAKEKDEKASTASEKDEEEEEAEGEEDEEELSEKEENEKKGKKKGVPLLDQPLETSGKRERKNVQRFEEEPKETKDTKLEIEEGTGTPLCEIPRVEASIARFKNDDLKVLHRLLFKTAGKSNVFKKNIKKFNGFSFKKDSDEYKKRVESCHKIEVKVLKSICEMLDLEKKGNKDEIIERIMDFLLEPKDSGKPVSGGRPKRASAVRANNRGYSSHDDYSSDDKHSSRARRDKGKRPNLKDESSSDEEFKPGDASDASDEKPRTINKRKRGRAKKGSSEEDEASLSAGSSDESDDVPKSKRRKSITKATPKATPKKAGRGRGRPGRGTPAAAATPTPRKSGRERKPVRKHVSSDEDEKNDDGSSSEDEPLVKKKAKTNEPPTDDEIKTYIKSILEGANLEEITMKTVCQRVYDNYPDFDLTARKNFIKSTVKSLIST